jgi:hypothetical protein
MESIKLTFLESVPDGLRRLTIANWAGVCLVLSRSRLHSALKTGGLAHPGVYILLGPSAIDISDHGRKLVFELYIGKSDSFDERIGNHDKFKGFWSTAFFFYGGGPEELHAGQTGDLERHLIARAQKAGHKVTNVANPKLHGAPAQSDSTDIFLTYIETILKALGYDFFSSQGPTEPPALKPLEPVAELEIAVPENLRRTVDQIRAVCLTLPAVEFYGTHVPDLRAKVVSAHGSRIFARIQFRKQTVKLTLKGQVFTLKADTLVDEEIERHIRDAYSRASRELAD